MKRTILITVAAALAAAGSAFAQDADGFEPIPAITSSSHEAAEFVPMTRSERFGHYVAGTFGPGSVARAAAIASLAQLQDSPKEWPQGGEGFADRLGNAYARHIIRGTLQYGASSALHEDDRYFESGQSGFWNRARYAISRTFLARRDNGRNTLAIARLSSAAGAAFISRAWQPASSSGAGNTASCFGFSIATDIGSNLFREFWPDLKKHFRRI